MSSSNRFYRYILNPVMRSLLRSPLHGVTSHNIGNVHFSVRKSGRRLSTPLSYSREGNVVRLQSNQSTRWWLNFRGEGVKVEMEIARKRYPGTAVLLEGDSEALREGVRRFTCALPRDAKVYGLELDTNGEVVETSLAPVGRLIRGLDSHIVAMLAGRSPVGPRPDLNTPAALYPFNPKAGYAYNRYCVGHRYSLH